MEFRVLGPLEVLDAGSPVPLGSAKERALLARLLVSANRVVPVDRLIDDLWGESATDQAIANLRVYVSRLRKRLGATGGAIVVTSPPGYLVSIDSEQLDAARFESLATRARSELAGGDPAAAAASAREAIGLWRGPALAGLSGYAFAQPEAARLEELRWGVVEDRIEADLARGLDAELVGELSSLVDRQPYRERLWAQLMVALYRSGRQAEALRTYERLRLLLADDLGISPSPDLAALEADILAQSPALAAPGPARPWSAAPSHPDRSARPGGVAPAPADDDAALDVRPAPAPGALPEPDALPFVGRQADLEVLLSWWDKACAGELRIAVVSGAPGIGKTRLAQELAAHVWDDGGAVLLGRCDEGMVVPYQPFLGPASQFLAGRPPETVEAWSLPGALELATLLPGYGPALPEARRLEADPPTRRFWLFEAFLSVLRQSAEEVPLLLILDDLQWADEPTLRLLRHVAEHGRDLPLLIVATLRAPDRRGAAPTTDLLADLNRVHRFDRVSLGPLPHDEVVALIARRATGPGDAAELLAYQAEGNPFFLGELLAQAASAGWALPPSDAEDPGRGATPAGEEVPPRIRDVVLRHVASVAPVAGRFLEAGAVAGRQFLLDVVQKAAELGESELLEAVDTAVDTGLVDEVSGAFGTYRFSHGLVRQCIYDQIGSPRRARLHRRIGIILAEGGAGPDGHRMVESALHLAEGILTEDDARRVLDALGVAARQLVGRLAYEDAARIYRRALEIHRTVSASDQRGRCSLLLRLADAEAKAGEVDVAREVLTEAAELARECEAPDLFARSALAYATEPWGFGYTMPDQSRLAVLEEALERLDDGHDRLRAEVMVRLSVELYADPDVDLARCLALTRDAEAIAEPIGDRRVLLEARLASLVVRMGPDLPVDAFMRQSEEVLDLAEEVGEGGMLLSARQLRQAALLLAGDMAGAERETEMMRDMAEELSLPTFEYWSKVYRTMLDLAAGRFTEAERAAPEAFAAGQRIDPGTASGVFGAQMVVVLWARGGLEAAVAPVRAMVSQFPQIDAYRAALALTLAEVADPEAPTVYRHFADRRFTNLPWGSNWTTAAYMVSMACDRIGTPEDGAALHSLLAPYADLVAAPGVALVTLGSVATAAAIAARVAGRLADADALFARGAQRNRDMGVTPFLAYTLWGWSRCKREMGESGEASRLEEEAAALASDIGMTGLLRSMDRASSTGTNASSQ